MKVSDEIVEAMTLASKTLYEVIGLDTSSLGVGLGLGGSAWPSPQTDKKIRCSTNLESS